MLLIVLRQDEASPAKSLVDLFEGLRIGDDLSIGDAGHSLASEVVLGGPDAAGGYHNVRTFQSAAEDAGHPVEIVSDRGFVEEVDAVFGESLRYPCGVGVDDLAEQKLRAYRHNFSIHCFG